ncbi:MAG: hypothetical protein PUG67_04055 [Peptoniphilaceae bacterium]|nr:hypothetical protein [Peptoniphilaceae bacterium]MDY6018167.1 hypothetical protein [Anaerococcus sp.]
MKINKIHKLIFSSLVFTGIFLQANTSLASGNSIYYYENVDIDNGFLGNKSKSSVVTFKAKSYMSQNTNKVVVNKEDRSLDPVAVTPLAKNTANPLSPLCRLGLNPQELALVINKAYPKNKLIKDNDPILIEGFTKTLVELENELGINPFFILGIINTENPIMRGEFSNLVKKKNNLMSWTAYDHDPFNKASKFDTYSAAIIGPARFLATNYLSPNGKYYVDGSVEGVNKYYASAKNWYKNVNSSMKRLNDAKISLGL